MHRHTCYSMTLCITMASTLRGSRTHRTQVAHCKALCSTSLMWALPTRKVVIWAGTAAIRQKWGVGSRYLFTAPAPVHGKLKRAETYRKLPWNAEAVKNAWRPNQLPSSASATLPASLRRTLNIGAILPVFIMPLHQRIGWRAYQIQLRNTRNGG